MYNDSQNFLFQHFLAMKEKRNRMMDLRIAAVFSKLEADRK